MQQLADPHRHYQGDTMQGSPLLDHDRLPRVGRRDRLRKSLVWGAARRTVALAAVVLVVTAGVASASPTTSVSKAPVIAFQAAGDVGGGVLEPGTTYPPTTHGFAILQRRSDRIKVNIHTSGLPAGAYTVWWVVFDTPAGCSQSCGEDDLFNPDSNASVFWATGGVVDEDGRASFRALHRVGDNLGDPGTQHLLGDGSIEPSRAEIHNIIKYHGPASDDPEALYEQTHTVHGSCDQGANAVDLGPPFGVQCFDPQAVAHPLP